MSQDKSEWPERCSSLEEYYRLLEPGARRYSALLRRFGNKPREAKTNVMTKRILLDIDGVLANFVAGAGRLHNRDPQSVTIWNFIESWGLTATDFWTPMDYYFWRYLPVYPEAAEIVESCEKAVGAENVCLLTSPYETAGCLEGKRDWVRLHFPQYKRRMLIGAAKEFCASSTSLLVDDSDASCESFRRAGGWVCLYPRPWNKNAHTASFALGYLRQELTVFGAL